MLLYSYEKVWKVEKKVYSIQNIHLPAPIAPAQFGYFAVVLLIVFVLCKIFPFLEIVPALIRYLAVPFLLTQFLMKKKLDGKAPHRFFADYIKYIFTRSTPLQFFRRVSVSGAAVIKLNWNCGTRTV